MAELTRQQFFRTVLGAAATAVSAFASAAPALKPKIKLAVTLYSYTGEYMPTTALDGCIADAAAAGAEGIDVISETHIPNYPNPSGKWVEHWHELMRTHRIEPGCYDCKETSRLRKAGPLTPEESFRFLMHDMELAHRLGFKLLRPAWGGPGQNSAAAWPEMAQQALPYAEKYDIRLAPEIGGSMASNPRVADAYMDLIERTNTRRLGLLAYADMFQRLPGGAASREFQPLLPCILHLRGKISGLHTFNPEGLVWEPTDKIQQRENQFEAAIPLLVQNGYKGYISIDYEGLRSASLASNHLGRQRAQMKRLLVEA